MDRRGGYKVPPLTGQLLATDICGETEGQLSLQLWPMTNQSCSHGRPHQLRVYGQHKADLLGVQGKKNIKLGRKRREEMEEKVGRMGLKTIKTH